jgi:hypothetical protein
MKRRGRASEHLTGELETEFLDVYLGSSPDSAWKDFKTCEQISIMNVL